MQAQDLVDVASAIFEGAGVQVYRWDLISGLLMPEVGNPLALSDGPAPRKLGVGAAGRAAECGTPMLFDNYRATVGKNTPAGLAGVTTAMGAPLMQSGRLVGAVSVGIDSPRLRLGQDELTALAALACGWSSGQPLALLEAIYCLYRRPAVGFAYRLLNDRPAAEEVVQDVFLSVWRSRARYDAARGSLRTWVLTMVRNRAFDWLRARRLRATWPLTATELVRPGGEDPSRDAERYFDRAHILVALESLLPAQRQVIELAYFGGLSHSEIALSQQLPIGTVKSRIRLALERLRSSLEDEHGAARKYDRSDGS
ncbi:MAG: sigma-70 family RNA polymerase sigma factor [Chloroflexota bacterium]|nr:sigma-70 family RNA polymerase sigma factor [Chloroflexota bacterium]